MAKQYQGGICNPFAGTKKKAQFKYEVLDQSVVKKVIYNDGVDDYEEPECQILIGTLSGGVDWSQEKFLCTISGEDALKPLRQGEIISANLHFGVIKKEEGSYEQRVSATEIFTLNDYALVREAEAGHQGELLSKNKFKEEIKAPWEN